MHTPPVARCWLLAGAWLLAPGGPARGAAPTPEPWREGLERPGDPPRAPRRGIATAPPARPRVGSITSLQVNVAAGGANILGDAANEPSLAVDPTNPNHMAIGWRQFDDVFSDFRQAGWAWTENGGRTWYFSGVLDPGVFRSDPVLTADATGRFYYSSLTSNSGSLACDVFVSATDGRNWYGPTPAFGGDKQWITTDRTSGIGTGHLYQSWSAGASCCGTNSFTRSVNGGATFMTPMSIPSRPQWGSMDVGPDGALYIAGADGTNLSRIVVAKSTSAMDRTLLPAFDFVRVVPLGGSVRVFQGPSSPNPDGLLGQVWLAVDPSDGPTAGWVYVACSVDPPGSDPLDVMFARSTDGGLTWSPPVRVNDDAPGAWQWFGTLAVAPNGRLDIVWNDTRNTGAPNLSELHYAFSTDGGDTWSPNVKLSPEWDSHVGWPNQSKIGDYYHLVSDRVGASLAWAATFNGEQDVWFLRIGDRDCNGNGIGDATDIDLHTSHDWNENRIPDECDGLQLSDAAPPASGWRLYQNAPNPFNPSTAIAFDAAADGSVQLEILDVAGRRVRTLGGRVRAGRNVLHWDGRDARGAPAHSGVYVYCLMSPGADTSARRMVLLR